MAREPSASKPGRPAASSGWRGALHQAGAADARTLACHRSWPRNHQGRSPRALPPSALDVGSANGPVHRPKEGDAGRARTSSPGHGMAWDRCTRSVRVGAPRRTRPAAREVDTRSKEGRPNAVATPFHHVCHSANTAAKPSTRSQPGTAGSTKSSDRLPGRSTTPSALSCATIPAASRASEHPTPPADTCPALWTAAVEPIWSRHRGAFACASSGRAGLVTTRASRPRLFGLRRRRGRSCARCRPHPWRRAGAAVTGPRWTVVTRAADH